MSGFFRHRKGHLVNLWLGMNGFLFRAQGLTSGGFSASLG
jgi:hypothetical protein